MLHSGQILAARYALLRKLGEGRATQVWQARDREGGVDRAVKVLTSSAPGARDEFLAAARLQQQLVHPNLQACEAVDDGEPPFAVFAHVAGGDLTSLRGRAWSQLLPVLAGVVDGLAALHARGLVHRDLKPANVLVGDDDAPVLADFGLAAAVGDAGAASGGSPFSMSPQQLEGAPPAPADDIYAFGALAYELLGGYPPFYPDPRPERVRSEAPAALSARMNVPPSLEQLVLRCLAKDPQARPASAADVATELRALAAAVPTVASAPVAPDIRLSPPASGEPAINPQWTRAAPSGPTPHQLRSQGFRRGLVAASFGFLLLAAAFVFFVLPGRVERSTASAPPPEPDAAEAEPQPPPGSRDLQQLAEAKRAFEELRTDGDVASRGPREASGGSVGWRGVRTRQACAGRRGRGLRAARLCRGARGAAQSRRRSRGDRAAGGSASAGCARRRCGRARQW